MKGEFIKNVTLCERGATLIKQFWYHWLKKKEEEKEGGEEENTFRGEIMADDRDNLTENFESRGDVNVKNCGAKKSKRQADGDIERSAKRGKTGKEEDAVFHAGFWLPAPEKFDQLMESYGKWLSKPDRAKRDEEIDYMGSEILDPDDECPILSTAEMADRIEKVVDSICNEEKFPRLEYECVGSGEWHPCKLFLPFFYFQDTKTLNVRLDTLFKCVREGMPGTYCGIKQGWRYHILYHMLFEYWKDERIATSAEWYGPEPLYRADGVRFYEHDADLERCKKRLKYWEKFTRANSAIFHGYDKGVSPWVVTFLTDE